MTPAASAGWQARLAPAKERRIAHLKLRSRIRSVLRFAVLTVRWIGVAIALLVWFIVVPLVDLLWSLLAWLGRRVNFTRRRCP